MDHSVGVVAEYTAGEIIKFAPVESLFAPFGVGLKRAGFKIEDENIFTQGLLKAQGSGKLEGTALANKFGVCRRASEGREEETDGGAHGADVWRLLA